MFDRPGFSECATFYHHYLRQAPEGNIITFLEKQLERALTLFETIDEEQAGFRYQPGKWSIKEVLGHLTDTERVFAYRALCFARRDPQPLPGMEQDDYVLQANFNERSWTDLVEEFNYLRRSNLVLFKSFDPSLARVVGTASGVPFTLRALIYIIAGHTEHHLKILGERYLS